MSEKKTIIQVDETTKQVFLEFQQLINQGFNEALSAVVETELQEKQRGIYQQMHQANHELGKLLSNFSAGAEAAKTFIDHQAERTLQIQARLEELKNLDKVYMPVINEIRNTVVLSSDLLSQLQTMQQSVTEQLVQYEQSSKSNAEKIGSQIQQEVNSGIQLVERANQKIEQKSTDLQREIQQVLQKVNEIAAYIETAINQTSKELSGIGAAQSANAEVLRTMQDVSAFRFEQLQEILKKSEGRISFVESRQTEMVEQCQELNNRMGEILQIQSEIRDLQKLPWYKKIFGRN